MILVNPRTRELIDVPDDHGVMLLKQRFYRKPEKTDMPVLKKVKPKRSRKNERPNKQG